MSSSIKSVDLISKKTTFSCPSANMQKSPSAKGAIEVLKEYPKKNYLSNSKEVRAIHAWDLMESVKIKVRA